MGAKRRGHVEVTYASCSPTSDGRHPVLRFENTSRPPVGGRRTGLCPKCVLIRLLSFSLFLTLLQALRVAAAAKVLLPSENAPTLSPSQQPSPLSKGTGVFLGPVCCDLKIWIYILILKI